jgi:hypothetical protein
MSSSPPPFTSSPPRRAQPDSDVEDEVPEEEVPEDEPSGEDLFDDAMYR